MPVHIIRFVTSSLGGFLSVTLLGLALERLFPLDGRHLRFKDLRFGIMYGAVNQFLIQGVSPLYGALSALIGSLLFGWKFFALPSTGVWFFVSTAIYVLAGDCLLYWFHRAFHTYRPLWKIHSFHHSDENFNVFTTWRQWFLTGPLLGGLVVYMPLGIVLRPTVGMVVVVLIMNALSNTLSHLNARIEFGPLSLWFMNPQFHRIHHSIEPEHLNRNFAGTLPIWDVLFGTAWKPRRGEFPSTGLVPRTVEENLINALVWPAKFQ